MTPEQRRISRFKRLERIRAVAKRQLAAETAEAEGILANLNALTERTRELADEYVSRRDPADGYSLLQLSAFAAGLCEIVRSSGHDAANAKGHADRKMGELAAAERRRAAVEQQLVREERMIGLREETEARSTRKRVGTELE